MQGGRGKANTFLFTDLNMTEVRYPIYIDQFYCPQGNCPERVRKPTQLNSVTTTTSTETILAAFAGRWCGHNGREIHQHPGDVLGARGHPDPVQQKRAVPRDFSPQRGPLLGQPHGPNKSQNPKCSRKRRGHGEATSTLPRPLIPSALRCEHSAWT